ncbi:hypothetical protein L6452_26309 [Arctium lappa]|uniref:Uncharacterized protein n=1 Tax=Arctium lappa TaxID=4217 RepID=A0ACB9AGX0_ARCLA|nr:hypothetical protein L6452_26309 [Arctium lappa]
MIPTKPDDSSEGEKIKDQEDPMIIEVDIYRSPSEGKRKLSAEEEVERLKGLKKIKRRKEVKDQVVHESVIDQYLLSTISNVWINGTKSFTTYPESILLEVGRANSVVQVEKLICLYTYGLG